MMKGLTLSALLGVLLLLQTGCAWRDSGYSQYPYSYDTYYGYPYSSHSWWPYSYYGYYGYPYASYYRWPYRSYHYRDYRYRPLPGERFDDDHRIDRPRPPQSPPPERRPPRLEPLQPKDGGRSPLDRPFHRNEMPAPVRRWGWGKQAAPSRMRRISCGRQPDQRRRSLAPERW